MRIEVRDDDGDLLTMLALIVTALLVGMVL
jgi:hypothetical protein